MIQNAARERFMRSRTIFSLAVVAILAAGSLLVWPRIKPTSSDNTTAVAPIRHAPTLYCDFYDLMHKAVVVSFDFAVETTAKSQPIFTERYVVEPDNTRTDFGEAGQPTPVWSYTFDDDTPTITAADGATRIILYGFKPSQPGVFWIEAGVRSNAYRNLEGRCRQAYISP